MWKQQIKITKYDQNKLKSMSDTILIEVPFKLVLNGEEILSTSMSPRNQKALVIGYLKTHQLIQNISDIQSLHIEHNIAKTIIQEQTTTIEHLSPQDYFIPYTQLPQLTAIFQDHAMLYRSTGTCHSAGLFQGTECISFSDDISRFNALYKTVGTAMLNNHSFDKKVLICSGKICHRIIQWLANVGIVMIASRTGITNMAYNLARDHGITAIGFARGKHYSIYTHQHRLIKPS